MDRQKQERVQKIFRQARRLPKSEVDSFLDAVCGDDAELGVAVERLLAEEQQADTAGVPNPGSGDQAGSPASADRNLLVGIIALQMDFIDRNALVQAMNAWVLSKKTSLEQILISLGEIDEKTSQLLTALVDRHLEYHEHNPPQSLAALSSVEEIKTRLKAIQDTDLEQSLLHLKSHRRATGSDVLLGTPSSKRGRFRVLRRHKSGGLGTVHVARDEELNRDVALKEVRPEYAEIQAARERLQVEAEITGGLEHPGIVPVYGLGIHDDGNPFYCMRFIKGQSLKDAIAEFHASKAQLPASLLNLKLRGLLGRFINVCDAVGYAHCRSVLHRDLKPGNIMLGKYGETLVVDWGLAKATGGLPQTVTDTEMPIIPKSGSTAAPTVAGSAMGTPDYMSPEQAAGDLDHLGPATDVYSLGATLYCLLTGRPPITGATLSEKLERAREGRFATPSQIDRWVPKALEAICLKAMARIPGDRYASPAATFRRRGTMAGR